MKRALLKKLMPASAKRMILTMRDRLNGPGIEYAVLRDLGFVPDESPEARINLIIPSVAKAEAFGGMMTGLGFFRELMLALKAHGVSARIIVENTPHAGENVLENDPDLKVVELLGLDRSSGQVSVRQHDLFLAYNWWTSLNIEPLLQAQVTHFGGSPLPKLHLIQEYEPHFYPFSAAHLLAREAMGASWPLWGIFNTTELHSYWEREQHTAEKHYVFEPRINAKIRPFLDGLTPAHKTRTMLVYGRPQVARNAFFLIEQGLKAWGQAHGAKHNDWRIVSAGMAHDDLDLGGGHVLHSLGKLSLDAYGQLLRETAIGVSLMVSPHPSYPPLEMAHFGARVLTNTYPGKIPGARHENIAALPGLSKTAIADAIEAEILRHEADPGAGLAGKSHMPDYLGPEEFGCLPQLTADIVERLGA